MGKPTGFMEYERQVSVAEEPKERIKHLWNAVYRFVRQGWICAV